MVTGLRADLGCLRTLLAGMNVSDLDESALKNWSLVVQALDRIGNSLKAEENEKNVIDFTRCRICGILLDPQNPGSLCDGCMDDKERRYNEKITF